VRVAVVDMGTNSTRLLVADVDDSRVKELERRSTVTRLGRGVDTTQQLATEAIEDVANTVGEYLAVYEPLKPDVVSVLATSAVRDAGNSGAFIAELRERFAMNARILTGS
jgi:exopolyphosphatase/guanosine-5'-triphosphate,3'-diphosphate pyrophosphatase